MMFQKDLVLEVVYDEITVVDISDHDHDDEQCDEPVSGIR